MDALVRHFSDLKFALQELESAVQQPRDEAASAEHILYDFPAVMSRFAQIFSELLGRKGIEAATLLEIFTMAHGQGWLKGDISLWLFLAQSYEDLGDLDTHSPESAALAHQVRASSSMLWQTYELITQRFRWQTSVTAVPIRVKAPAPLPHRPLHCA